MKPPITPIAAEVRQDVESEAALIEAAKQAISSCSWKLGEIASQWTARWARGRTDADFGAAVGMTGDQVYQRRRVWDRFGETDIYRNLSWSHFYAAIGWDNAECFLQWACDNQATVAEMKAWRDAQFAQSRAADEFLSGMGETVDDDPFGEGASGAGTDAGDGTETAGTDSDEEEPPRPSRNGTEESGGESPPKDPFLTHKAKAVKTLEAGMRVIDDLNGVRHVPQHDSMIKALGKMIQTIKGAQ